MEITGCEDEEDEAEGVEQVAHSWTVGWGGSLVEVVGCWDAMER